MTTGIHSIRLSVTDLAAAASMGFAAPSTPPAGTPRKSFDAAARNYVNSFLQGRVTPSFAAADDMIGNRPPVLQLVEMTSQPITDTTIAGYSQSHLGVPIYGMPVGVEMEQDTSFVGIDMTVSRLPENISPFASIAPSEAVDVVREIAGLKRYERLPPLNAPQLNFRLDSQRNEWNLVYIFDSVEIPEEHRGSDELEEPPEHAFPHWSGVAHAHGPNLYRVFIDAHTGKEVARVAQKKSARVAASYDDTAVSGGIFDFFGNSLPDGTFELFDEERGTRTYSMQFDDIVCGPMALPGQKVSADAAPSAEFKNRAAVIAHTNAAMVADFFREVLLRNSIDDNGMEIVSVVDCTNYRYDRQFGFCRPQNPVNKTYRNAAWIRDTRPTASAILKAGIMVYGQQQWTTDSLFHSYSEALDVVGHELSHGITDYTSDLEYMTESGALNESYSDIFGISIANSTENDVANWNWKLGEALSPDGIPTRDLEDPKLGHEEFRFELGNQPDHMDDFAKLGPNGEADPRDPTPDSTDSGYVHYNSGIHNKAAYNVMQSGKCTWQEFVQLYYLTLTTPGRLSQTATFLDSRDGMIASCNALFRNASNADRIDRVNAIRDAYSAVGIKD